MIYLKNIDKSFKDVTIFKNMNLTIESAGIHIIQGYSGCGKSTLLHMIMGFEEVDHGEIITSVNPTIIFQNYELISTISVKDNILLGRPDSYLDYELIEYFGLKEFLNRKPKELSNGQQQRVGIIRALSYSPSIILCDEPTESLDVMNKKLVMDLLKELAKDSIVVVVTHDKVLAEKYGDFFYEFKENQLVLTKQSEYISYRKKNKIGFENKEMNHIFSRLFSKKMKLASSLHMVLLLSIGILLLVQNIWFEIPNSKKALNADYAYVEILNDKPFTTDDFLALGVHNPVPLVKFKSIYHGVRNYKANIYPYIGDKKFEGVYLNQNALSEMKDLKIGDTVSLTYYIRGLEYCYDTVVAGFIEEDDVGTVAVYYCYDTFKEYLESIPFVTGSNTYSESYESISKNQWEWQMQKVQLYQVSIPFEKQPVLFELTDKRIDIDVYSPITQERLALIEQVFVYRYIYIGFSIILFVALVISTTVFLIKSVQSAKENIAVLISQGMNLAYLVKRYLLYEMLCFSLSIIISMIILLAIYKITLSSIDRLLIPLKVCFTYLLYLILVIYLSCKSIKTTDILNILKEKE